MFFYFYSNQSKNIDNYEYIKILIVLKQNNNVIVFKMFKMYDIDNYLNNINRYFSK